MLILISFIGGIITFISPCILPLVPVYIAYMSGISVQELKDNKKPSFFILLHSLFFVAGFSIIFSTLAAVFYIFVQSFGPYRVWFNRIAGLLIILFGLSMIGFIKIPFLNYELRLKLSGNKNSLFGSFIMGVAFGAGWSPCVGPILSSILFTSTTQSNPLFSILLLMIYSVGIGIPFILTGLITNFALTIFEFIKKHYRTVETISGLFLIVLGIFLLFDLIGVLSGLFSSIIPFSIDLETKIIK